MTTEREMLEFAAKACGITVHGLADKFVAQHDYGSSGLCVANDRGGDSLWNSVYEDGKLVSKEPFVWSEKEEE